MDECGPSGPQRGAAQCIWIAIGRFMQLQGWHGLIQRRRSIAFEAIGRNCSDGGTGAGGCRVGAVAVTGGGGGGRGSSGGNARGTRIVAVGFQQIHCRHDIVAIAKMPSSSAAAPSTLNHHRHHPRH